jgi:hypothetical protein
MSLYATFKGLISGPVALAIAAAKADAEKLLKDAETQGSALVAQYAAPAIIQAVGSAADPSKVSAEVATLVSTVATALQNARDGKSDYADDALVLEEVGELAVTLLEKEPPPVPPAQDPATAGVPAA